MLSIPPQVLLSVPRLCRPNVTSFGRRSIPTLFLSCSCRKNLKKLITGHRYLLDMVRNRLAIHGRSVPLRGDSFAMCADREPTRGWQASCLCHRLSVPTTPSCICAAGLLSAVPTGSQAAAYGPILVEFKGVPGTILRFTPTFAHQKVRFSSA